MTTLELALATLAAVGLFLLPVFGIPWHKSKEG